jgi:hypothetical protein
MRYEKPRTERVKVVGALSHVQTLVKIDTD